MSISAAVVLARTQIKREEGCVLHAYPDPLTGAEPFTIGYGHTGPDVHLGVAWTQEKADMTLDVDLADCVADLDRTCTWWDRLSEPRMAAMISMVFQLGIGGLLRFHHAVAAMQAGDWDTASAELLASRWAAQTPARAKRIAHQVLTGIAA